MTGLSPDEAALDRRAAAALLIVLTGQSPDGHRRCADCGRRECPGRLSGPEACWDLRGITGPYDMAPGVPAKLSRETENRLAVQREAEAWYEAGIRRLRAQRKESGMKH